MIDNALADYHARQELCAPILVQRRGDVLQPVRVVCPESDLLTDGSDIASVIRTAYFTDLEVKPYSTDDFYHFRKEGSVHFEHTYRFNQAFPTTNDARFEFVRTLFYFACSSDMIAVQQQNNLEEVTTLYDVRIDPESRTIWTDFYFEKERYDRDACPSGIGKVLQSI